MKVNAKQLGKSFAKLLSEAKGDGEKKELVAAMAKFIVAEGKISRLASIKQSFNKYWDEISGEIEIEVETADGSLPQLPVELEGKKIIVKVKANSSLLGGTIIKIGDYSIDNSLRSKIRKLSNISK